MSDTHKALV